MSSILDTIVPARRREKQRRHALEKRLHTRFGDPAITAPVEGGWSSFPPNEERRNGSSPFPVHEAVQGHTPVSATTDDNDGSSAGKVRPATDTVVTPEAETAKLTITIPLPWTKKSHRRSISYHGQATADAPEFPDSPLRCQISSPIAVLYKPASEHYRKELEASLSKPASVTASPVLYRAASEGYKKELDDMANLPSLRHTTSDAAPYESVPEQKENAGEIEPNSKPLKGGTQPAPTDTSVPSIDDRASLTTDGSSSPSIRSKDGPNTPPAASPISDHATTELAQLGLTPSPGLKQGAFPTFPSTSTIDRTKQHESVSSASSIGTEGPLRSPRNLQDASMPGGSYYRSVADDYKQIAKTVENAAVVEYQKSVWGNSAHNPYLTRATEASVERPKTPGKEIMRATPAVAAQRRRSMEKIREHERLNKFLNDDQIRLPERFRNVSVDRSIGLQHERRRALSGERNRGKSVERAVQVASKEQFTKGPQQLVPQEEELWG